VPRHWLPVPQDSVQDCSYCIRLHPWHLSSYTLKTFAPQWSTPPVRPIAVTCSSSEPRHSSTNEASVLLLQLSGTLFLFICARHPSAEDDSSWFENSYLQPSLHQPLRTIYFKSELTYLLTSIQSIRLNSLMCADVPLTITHSLTLPTTENTLFLEKTRGNDVLIQNLQEQMARIASTTFLNALVDATMCRLHRLDSR